MSHWRRRTLWLILLMALVVRVGWVLTRAVDEPSLAALPDQREYLEAGRNLLAGEGLWFTDPRFEQRILASRTIGYPLLIAACGGSARVVQLVQCLLDVSTVLAVYLLARRWLNERRSLLAAAITALNPLLVYFCALVLTETLYVSLMAWSLYLVTRAPRLALGAIVLAALSVHVRPSGLLMPLVLGMFAGWWNWRERRVFGTVAGAVLGAVVLLAVLAPWALRNKMVLGEWVWMTTNGGMTLYDGVHPRATGASDQSFVRDMPELKSMNELQRDAHLRTLARGEIRDDFARVAGLAVIKAARTWSPVPLSDQYASNRLYVAAGLLYTVPLFLFAAWGLLRSRLPAIARCLLIAPALVITLMHATSVGSMRYRLPAEPMLAVLAAGACLGIGGRPTREKLPSDA